MRTYRPLFEHYVHKDDLQQRRLLRSSTLAARQMPFDDAFEEYLALMSRNGTYGGEPELVAFCQVYNQDVTVHLPTIQNYDRDSITYKNEQRVHERDPVPLHICYGGDEVTRAHYDSARTRDGNGKLLDTGIRLGRMSSLKKADSRSRSRHSVDHVAIQAQRHGDADLSSEKLQEFLQKSRREREGSFERLNEKNRGRSLSVSSSHRSSSSKRSLEDDTEHRAVKKADRRKSIKKRADALIPAPDPPNELSFRLRIDSPSPGTPASTQDTEYSSDAAEPSRLAPQESGSGRHSRNEEASDSEASLERAMREMKAHSRGRKVVSNVTDQINPLGRIEVANAIEPRRTSLR